MKTKAMTEELVLAVIRGQLPLTALEEIGIHFQQISDGNSEAERQTRVEVPFAKSVSPRPVDIASGLLAYKDRPVQLREWASFVLGASEIIDLEPLERWPEGDELLSGLWDASFDGSLRDNTARVAALLVR